MDVLLTAVCCCLVPTPVNSHVRAHNLLQVSSLTLNDWAKFQKIELIASYLKFQVHSAFTNLLLLLVLLLAVFFSLDYNRPIVGRSEEVII